MATKSKSNKPAPVAVEAPGVLGNMAQALAAPAAPVLTGVRAAAAKVLAANPQAINGLGVALAGVSANIASKGTGTGQYPATVLASSYTLGAKLQGGNVPTRAPHDVAAVHALQSITGAQFTGAQIVAAGVPWHTTREYLKRGYVVAA